MMPKTSFRKEKLFMIELSYLYAYGDNEAEDEWQDKIWISRKN